MTVGKKLGLAFLLVITIMAASAGVAYYNVMAMRASMAELLDESLPVVRSSDQLLSAVNRDVGGIRGYMLLGAEKAYAQRFRTTREESWRDIDTEIARLTDFAASWPDAKDRGLVLAAENVIDQLRTIHDKVMAVAHTPENVPAQQMLVDDAQPQAEKILKVIANMRAEARAAQGKAEGPNLAMLIDAVHDDFSSSFVNLELYTLSREPTFKQAFSQSWDECKVAVQAVEAAADKLSVAQREQWGQCQRWLVEFQPLPAKLIALRESNQWNVAQDLVENESLPAITRLRAVLSDVNRLAEQRAQSQRQEVDAAGHQLLSALVAATLVGIALATIVAIALSRTIASMMRRLSERAKEISEGDLTGTVIAAKASDELGQLANGFDTMLERLKDLTGQIMSVSENVNSATSQIASSAKQQASSTREQAATVQEITSTMQEISQSGAQIVEKAREVAAAAETASRSNKVGIDAVQNTSRTMEAIREQVEEVAENIVALSEKTQAVGEIIATVNDIAEQSNLLALNATIEAADSEGRGNRFAVVAGEMKNLADQAKECTVQVRKILGEIQKGINSSVMLTEEAVKRVEAGKQQADVTEEAIRQMFATTEESVQAFQQIIGATNQQQIGFDQVAKGMREIDDATRQTATGTAQLEQAVAGLSAMSKQLRTAVSIYKLNRNPVPVR